MRFAAERSAAKRYDFAAPFGAAKVLSCREAAEAAKDLRCRGRRRRRDTGYRAVFSIFGAFFIRFSIKSA